MACSQGSLVGPASKACVCLSPRLLESGRTGPAAVMSRPKPVDSEQCLLSVPPVTSLVWLAGALRDLGAPLVGAVPTPVLVLEGKSDVDTQWLLKLGLADTLVFH